MNFLPNASQGKVLECRSQLCVIAGAGSGKTGTLVETLVRRLADGLTAGPDGLDVTQILALTFTEKAAAELRQRLAQAFEERRATATTGPAMDFWRNQASRLDRADIGTIHGYALKLVRENALTLGWPSDLSIDEDERALDRDLAEIFTNWLEEADHDLLNLLSRLTPAELRLMMRQCATRQSAWGLGRLTAELTAPEADYPALLSAFEALIEESRNLAANGDLNPAKDYYRKVSAAVAGLTDLFRRPPAELAADIDQTLARAARLLDDSGDWHSRRGRPLKKQLLSALEDIQTRRNNQRAIPLKRSFLNLANQLPDRLTARKKNRGAINFDDILILARRLLAGHPSIRQREIRRRRLILIDEFQDTNRLQANLLAYLLLNPEDGGIFPEEADLWTVLDWPALTPRFSAFGDPKQSIYRFRGAEVEVMTGLGQAFDSGGGQVLALDQNYRSQEPLIRFFNTLFPHHLAEGFTGRDHQHPVRPPLYDGPHVVQLCSPEPPPDRSEERAEREAQILVRYLDDLFQGQGPGPVLVGDGAGGARLPHPGEVAILFRRFKWVGLFKKALLAAGWKCRLASGDNPFAYDEVRAVLAAFQFISGQDREISLAALLRSPLGPVSDNGLLTLVWPGEPHPGQAPCRLADYFLGARPWPAELDEDDLRALNRLRDLLLALAPLRGRLKPVEILERIVEEGRLIPLAVMEPDGQDRVRALTTLMALSRTLNDRRDSPLGPAEELMARRRDWDPRRDGREEGIDGQAITLMTVHGAKGLEFPVVVIAEADSLPRGRTDPVLISSQGQVALRFRNEAGQIVQPEDFQALQAEERNLDARENGRLLYVAATRARDHLVFLGFPRKARADAPRSGTIWLEALRQCPAAEALTTAVECEPLDPASRPRVPAAEAETTAAVSSGSTLNLIESVPLAGQALAATSLGELLADPAAYYQKYLGWPKGFQWTPGQGFFDLRPPDLSPPASPSSGRLTPAESGTLFHAVLEVLDPLRPDIDGLIIRQAAKRGLKPEAEELAGLAAKVAALISGPLGQAWRAGLAAGRPAYRELEFRMQIPGPDNLGPLLLTGVIDLFFLTADGGGQIVDYKLARPHPGPELDAYENQVRLYAQAVRAGGFTEPLSAALYFAGGRDPIIHPVPLADPDPLAPLWPAWQKIRPWLAASRPLRPGRPGPPPWSAKNRS